MNLLDDVLETQDKKAPREWDFDRVSEIDGRLTFLGIMYRYYNEVTAGWNADTQKNYFWDYRRFLLPDLSSRPLEAYTKEDFERTFLLLPERKKACGQVYHEKVLRHFWHITNRVLKIASKHEICPNVLWGSEELLPEETDEEAAEKELVRLKKSLTMQEELQIAEQILADPEQSGQRMGLALMFCLGLRNGEACGADFRDIHPMEGHPEIDCLLVYKSTKNGSNAVKMGGKTKNMGRMIPIPFRLKSLLDRRYSFLEEKAMAGELPGYGSSEAGSEALRDPKNLPIACDGLDFTRRCSARHLTKEGKAVLERSSVDEDVLSYISRDIRRDQEGVMEKDPTAYLFRRNFGTHLYLQGLEEREIQYIIGHEIEDPGEMRSIFRSEEKLYPIAQKMALWPIVSDVPETKYLVPAPGKVFQGQLFRHQLQIDVKGPLHLRVRISQREPGSGMRIELIPHHITLQGSHTQHQNMAGYERSLSTKGLYQQKYREAIERRRKKAEKTETEKIDCEKTV